MDYSAILVSIMNVLLIGAMFYFAYIMLKKMFKQIISEAINEAIIKLDEKIKILNAIRQFK